MHLCFSALASSWTSRSSSFKRWIIFSESLEDPMFDLVRLSEKDKKIIICIRQSFLCTWEYRAVKGKASYLHADSLTRLHTERLECKVQNIVIHQTVMIAIHHYKNRRFHKFHHINSMSVPNIQPRLTYWVISHDIKMGLLHKLIANPEIDGTALSPFSIQLFTSNCPFTLQHESLWHVYIICQQYVVNNAQGGTGEPGLSRVCCVSQRWKQTP